MPKTEPTLDELETAAAQALDKAAAAKRSAEAARQAETARQEARLEAFDRARLAAWPTDRATLEADVAASRSVLAEAVLADPVWRAYAAYVAATSRYGRRWLEASALSSTYGRGPFPEPPASAPEVTFSIVADLLQRTAENAVSDEMSDRQTARQTAATTEETR